MFVGLISQDARSVRGSATCATQKRVARRGDSATAVHCGTGLLSSDHCVGAEIRQLLTLGERVDVPVAGGIAHDTAFRLWVGSLIRCSPASLLKASA